MKTIRPVELIEAVEWDGSQKAFEAIAKMCPRGHEITIEDGYLVIFDHLYKFEEQADFGDFITVEDGEMSVIPRNAIGRWKKL